MAASSSRVLPLMGGVGSGRSSSRRAAGHHDRFAELLLQLAADGIAILLVEHDMDLVMKVCQRLRVLDFGELIARGSPKEVRSDARVQAAYLGTEDVA